MKDQLEQLASKLNYSGYFLDVAALPGADRIVGIGLDGITYTWTLDQAEALVKQLTQIKKAKYEARDPGSQRRA